MKARVAVLGTVGKSLQIDTEATKGATIGTNLFLPDGSVPTLTQLQALFGTEQPTVANTVWKLIQEIPPNVKEVELLATSGLVVRQPDGNWITRSIAVEGDGLLQIDDADGDAGPPTLGAAPIAALSVWGRSADSAGKPAPIAAAADTTLLRRSGNSVGFGTITSAYVSDFVEAAQDAIGAAFGDSARIDVAYDDTLNAFTADLIAGSVANTYLANMAQATIKGRASGAGAGAPADLSGAQVATIIGYTAADVLAKLLTVDGAGSGLDADLLDGISSAGFALAAHTHAIADVTGLTAALAAKLDASAYTAADVLAKLLTVDGAGSLLDADLLDGISSAGFFQTASPLLAVDGTALLPAYAHASDPDTGAYLVGAGQYGISLGGTQVLDLAAGTSQLHMASETPRVLIGSMAGVGTAGGSTNGIIIAGTSTAAMRLIARASAAAFNVYRINGSSGAPSAVLTNNNIFAFAAIGATDTTPTLATGAFMQMTATENWSGTNRGCRINFGSTATGGTTLSTTCIFLGTQAQFLDGAVGAPSVSFQNDTDCGIYRIAANQLGIACNATNVLDISTAQVAITATTIRLNTTAALTVGAAGAAAALPATPVGYLTINANGTACKIPVYNV